MENNFALKELYDVRLKCVFPMVINGEKFEAKESIIRFNKILVGGFNENKRRVTANGGSGNKGLIRWEDTTDISFTFSEGVISKKGFSILSNSKFLKTENGEGIEISFSENLETDENGYIELKYLPCNEYIFIYDAATGSKIKDYTRNGKLINLTEPFKEVIIDYNFNYTEETESLLIGRRLINGYLELEGKTKIKDDFDGKVKTGIFKIPHLVLESDLSIRLGKDVNPYIYRFNMRGYPVGEKGNQYVCELVILNNEIDADL